MLDNINVSESYKNIINNLIENLKIKLNNIDYKNTNHSFFFETDCLNKLKKFLMNLEASEKEEILLSLGRGESETSSTYLKKSDNLSKHLNSTLKISNGRGYDVLTTTKNRRGQNIFKRNLLNMLGDSEHKCAICGCNISGDQYLVASHIYPWKYSDNSQKTDGNNGFLLCPNHDFLFDSLFISFDEQGNILISDELSENTCKAFGLNNELSVAISQEKEIYMRKHRLAFTAKRWE